LEQVRDPFISEAGTGRQQVSAVLRSDSTAQVVGYGSHTTSSSSFSIPFAACGMRVIVLPPCPVTAHGLHGIRLVD
jgi:hypothetical protein